MELKHHPDRKNFQVDRLIFFTDALFAIAITLLVLEIHIPMVPAGASEGEFVNAMLELLPKFAGFLVSFFIIGLYWFVHHSLFGFVVNYTPKLFWLNLIFLLSIVLMPFSTSVYSSYSTPEHIYLVLPFAIYAANISFTGIMNYVLLNYIFKPENGVAEHIPSKDQILFSKRRALAIPAIFSISVLLTIFLPGIGRMFLFVIPFAMKFLRPKGNLNKSDEEKDTSKSD